MQIFIKKALSGLLSAAVAVGTFAFCPLTGNAVELLHGDVNGDSSVNSSDALAILNYSVGISELTELQLEKSDVNADGRVNSSDALDILKYSVNLIDRFKADEIFPDSEKVKSSFNIALADIKTKLPAYTHVETIERGVDDIKLSGIVTKFFSEEKILEMQNNVKKEYALDRQYTKLVKSGTDDSYERMIGEIDLSDESKFDSVSCSETPDGTYVLTVKFKDEENPSADSLIVKVTGLDDYDKAKKEVEEADEVGGAKSTVESFEMRYIDCVLKCEINKDTNEFVHIEWSAIMLSESKVTTAGLTVWMQASGKRGAEYKRFGY